MNPVSEHTYSLPPDSETVRVAYYGNPLAETVVILIAGYYTGAAALAPLAEALTRVGHKIAIIEPYGAPTWIDQTIHFSEHTPKILQSWVSAAIRGVHEINKENPSCSLHISGLSFGGPAAALVVEHTEYPFKSLTLIGPVGTQGPSERLALWLSKYAVTYPLGKLLGYLILYSQVRRVRIQKFLMKRYPEYYLAYERIVLDQKTKIQEGADSIGLAIGEAKLAFNITSHLQQLNLPVLIIGHAKDAYISLAALKRLAKMTGSKIHITPGTHDRPKTDPDSVAKPMLTFIQDKI